MRVRANKEEFEPNGEVFVVLSVPKGSKGDLECTPYPATIEGRRDAGALVDFLMADKDKYSLISSGTITAHSSEEFERKALEMGQRQWDADR